MDFVVLIQFFVLIIIPQDVFALIAASNLKIMFHFVCGLCHTETPTQFLRAINGSGLNGELFCSKVFDVFIKVELV